MQHHHKLPPKMYILISLLSVVLSLFFPAASAADDSALSPRKVRVGFYQLTNFQEYHSDIDEYRGYGYDYLLALSQYNNWTYEFVPVSYQQGLNMLAAGQLDLMDCIEVNDSMAPAFDFSAVPSGNTNIYLAKAPDDGLQYEVNSFSYYNSLRIGLNSHSTAYNTDFFAYCHSHDIMPHITYFQSQEQVLQALAAKQIDACLINELQQGTLQAITKISSEPLRFAVTHGNQSLLEELNMSLNDLKANDPHFEEKLYEKYYGANNEQLAIFSAAEKDYLATHPVIQVSYDPSWYPLSYRDSNGNFAGALAQIYKKIAEKTGLRFDFRASDTFPDALAVFASGQTQIMADFPYDYIWAEKHHAKVTKPFATITVVAAYMPGGQHNDTVALPGGYYQQFLSKTIRQDKYTFVNFDSIEECLDAVLRGDVEYAFLNAYQLEYFRGRGKYRDLSFKILPGMEYRLGTAVSDATDPLLFSIINKAIDSISSDEINNILKSSTLEVEPRSLTDLMYANTKTAILVCTIIGFLCALFIMSLIYSASIKKKNLLLEQATNARNEFFANISHDMRTPLNGVIGFTNLALESNNLSLVHQYLAKIKFSGNFLLQLINDTLDISKLENRKVTLLTEQIDSAELFDSIAAIIKPVAETKDIKLVVDMDILATDFIYADELRTRQIFVNLLSNAVKFTPGGGRIDFIIRHQIKNDINDYCITVRDNGIGISKEFLPQLFDAFAQEKQDPSIQVIGTGLGLSIVKQLVELMSGTIAVHSQKGLGTEFIVSLSFPKVSKRAVLPTMDSPIHSNHLTGHNILLVEDNAINSELAVIIFEKNGLNVTCATNGQEAIDTFTASPPDYFRAIFMDLRMPVMNGFDAAATIRKLSRSDAAEIPIIAMTADASSDDKQKCLAAGMNCHIAKPIDEGVILKVLADCTTKCQP